MSGEVSIVNPVDLYVNDKISMSNLMYSLSCGAIVTVMALRFNDMAKEMTNVFGKVLQDSLGVNAKKQAIAKILFDLITTVVLLQAFVRIAKLF